MRLPIARRSTTNETEILSYLACCDTPGAFEIPLRVARMTSDRPTGAKSEDVEELETPNTRYSPRMGGGKTSKTLNPISNSSATRCLLPSSTFTLPSPQLRGHHGRQRAIR